MSCNPIHTLRESEGSRLELKVQRESLHEADRDARDVASKGKVAQRGDDLYLEN